MGKEVLAVGEAQEKPERHGMLARIATVVTIVAGIATAVTGVVRLWPDGESSTGGAPTGRIFRLEQPGSATISEIKDEIPRARNCPGNEELPRERVGLPLATATLGLVAQADGEGGETPPDEVEPLPVEPTDEAEPEAGPEMPTVDELADDVEAPPERVEDLLYNAPPGKGENLSKAQVATIIAGTRLAPPGRYKADETVGPTGPIGPGEHGDGDGPSGPTGPNGPTGPEGGDGEMVPGSAPARPALVPAAFSRRGRTAGGRLEPLGWVIDAGAILARLEGKCAYVQWSVYDERTGRRVARKPWLVDRRGLRFVGRAPKDRQAGTFWVPIPREHGRYRLRVGLYDANATQLDFSRLKGLR